MTSTATRLQRESLQRQIDALSEEHQALAAQVLTTLDPTTKVRLERAMAAKLAEIGKLEAQLSALGSPPGEDASQAAPAVPAGRVARVPEAYKTTETVSLPALRDQIAEAFSREDLDLLCGDLSARLRQRGSPERVSPQDFQASSRRLLAQELIGWFERRRLLDVLLDELRRYLS